MLPDGELTVTGEKRYIGNAARAAMGVVFARERPGPLGIGAYLLEAPTSGLTATPLPMVGLRPVQICQVSFDAVRVPAENVLGRHLPRSRRGLHACLAVFNRLRPGVAALALGVAAGALELYDALEPAPGPLAAARRTEWSERVSAVRRLVIEAADVVDRTGDGSLAAVAKASACQLAERLTLDVCQALGPGARFTRPELDRAVRDARGLEFMEGTQNMQLLTAFHGLSAGRLGPPRPARKRVVSGPSEHGHLTIRRARHPRRDANHARPRHLLTRRNATVMTAPPGVPSFAVIGSRQVHDVLDGREPQVTDLVRQTYLRHAAGDTVNPPSYFLRFPDRPSARIIALPASIGAEGGVDGIKWISSVPDNVARGMPRASAVLILNDPVTGFPYACLESSIISAVRTAASAALAADVLTEGRPRPAVRRHHRDRSDLPARAPLPRPHRLGLRAGRHLRPITLALGPVRGIPAQQPTRHRGHRPRRDRARRSEPTTCSSSRPWQGHRMC